MQIDEALTDFEQQLVVEGEVTTDPGPYTVQLNYTGDVLGAIDRNRLPVSDAQVMIEDSDGNSYDLVESEPGVYLTNAQDFTGEIGKGYRLVFVTPADGSYESEFVVIPPTPVVTEADVDFQVFNRTNETNRFISTRVQQHVVSIEIQNSPDEAYFKVEAIGIEQRYVQPAPPLGASESCLAFYFGQTSEGPTVNCWQNKGDLSNGIRTISNDLFEPNSPLKIEAVTLPFNGRGTILATINVKSITASEFDFLNTLNKQNNLRADVFNPPLEAISGNIFSTSNDKEVVVGFFSAYSVSQQSICIERANISSVAPIPLVLAPCNTNCLTLYPNSTWEAPPEVSICE
ncbi:MAG: hypothetical protein ACI8QD_000403 [Cyclobacteriaceae bacterium]|jgi:hypothetical protein